MFRFAQPEYLYLLLIVPLIWVLYFYSVYKKKKNLAKFGHVKTLEPLMPDVSKYKPGTKFFLQQLALIVLVFLIARPQMGAKVETVKKQGVEIVVALDVSNSMLARDINTQLPITSDFVSAKMFLSSIDPNMVPTQGTAIGRAISLAMNSFTPDESADKAIIVITDGENHEDDAVAMAAEAAKKGIRVDVIGIGSPQGSPIPMSNESSDFRKDNEGNVVITKLNEQMGQEIAKAGEGIYVTADNTNSALRALTSQIKKMKKSDIESKVYSEYDEQFQGLAWIVLLLLLVDIFILARKNEWMKKFNFFTK